MSKRAVRRHHLRRMKAKALRINRINRHDGWTFNYDHLAVCSNECCGNQRRWQGLSMQEKRHPQYFCQSPLTEYP